MLSNCDEFDFHFFFGTPMNNSIKEIDFSLNATSGCTIKYDRLTNLRLKKLVVWQKGVLKICFTNKFDQAIFLGDMYTISTWLGAFIARIRGKKVIFWSHGITGRESSAKKTIRKLFFQIAHHHLLYGERGKEILIKEGFVSSEISVVYNSLDYDAHLKLRGELLDSKFYDEYFKMPNLPVLLFIGRLTADKELHLLMEAIKKLRDAFSTAVNLMIVGDGPMKKSLQTQSKDISEHVFFYGACYDEYTIGKLIANAALCVSPGNVGLTAIHSMSFGTPVCSHGEMCHQGPEAEVIVEGKTGSFFDKTKNDLAEKILQWLNSNNTRTVIRENCYKIIDEKYNPYYQLEVFKKVLLQN